MIVTPLIIARIYARAVFDFSVENNNMDVWQSMLMLFATVSKNRLMQSLYYRSLDYKVLSHIFITVCEDYQKEQIDCFGNNFINIIAENNRFLLLPVILKEFNYLKNKYASTISIEIISVYYLNNDQLMKITDMLARYLKDKIIKLINRIDPSILGGVVIRMKDTIIDGSIRGRMLRLQNILSQP